MKNLSNYIQALNFEYVILFSGLRGDAFTKLEKKNYQKIREIEKEIETARYMQVPKLKKEIRVLSDELNLLNARILDKDGNIHQSASEIYRFEKRSKELKSILDILTSSFKEEFFAVCAPVFRDALVFYSKESNITGIVQICFSCYRMENENREQFKIDHRIFSKLKKEFKQVGHRIDD